MEQPNVTGDGDAALNGRFWLAIVGTGIFTGLFGIAAMWLLFFVQHRAFAYRSGEVEAAIARLHGWRRALPLILGGAAVGPAWYLLRRFTAGEPSEIDDALWAGDATLGARRSIGTSILSEIAIGLGASIGREAAPKLLGGLGASWWARWCSLSLAQRRLVVACGGGAGLAAVYNVPLSGALFTAEILLGQMTLPVVLPALACSGIATAVGWLYLPHGPVYLSIPAYRFSISLLVLSLLAGPVIGLLAAGYIRLIGFVSHHGARGAAVIGAPLLAFSVLALIGVRYPQLYGNGKDIAHGAFLSEGGVALLGALFVLKPIVTALCLGSGASGGLFTPFFATGALFGAALGMTTSHLVAAAPGAVAMVCAAAMIGAAMQAPLVGLSLVIELTHSGFALMLPMIAATVSATAVTRYVDGYSIYTARLPSRRGYLERLPDDDTGVPPGRRA